MAHHVSGAMLALSFGILAATALLGIVLIFAQGAANQGPRLWRRLGLLHGLFGAAGLAVLLPALQGPPRGVTQGAASFGLFAASLLAAAVLAGLCSLLLRRRADLRLLVIGLHALLAVSGFVMLAVYLAMPA